MITPWNRMHYRNFITMIRLPNWWGCKAVKTDRYLYTEWRKKGAITHRMLFDHELDPMENINIAEKPDAQPVVDRLSALLEPQWKTKP